MTSSTKSRWERVREGEILIPLMRPLFLASLISRLRPSITKINRSGDNGHPCLIPREAGKKLEGVPLTKTAKFAVETQLIIQLTVRRGTPICIKISLI